MTIGRADENTIVVSDDAASSRHAAIEERTDGYYCVDRGSRSGTFINGAQIAAATRLRPGDELRVGNTRFLFVEGKAAAPHELPYPLIVSELLVRTEASAAGRSEAIVAAIERTLKFIVACELGALVDARRPPDVPRDRPLTGDEWLSLAVRLAPRVPDGPIRRAAGALVGRDETASRLARELGEALARRTGEPDAEHRALRELFVALSPLSTMSLVSRTALVDADFDRRTYTFEVRVHDGPSELFPVTQCETTEKLLPGWCYLVGGGRTVALAPLFGVGVAADGRKLELGDADRIATTPAVELRSVTTGSILTVPFVAKPRE